MLAAAAAGEIRCVIGTHALVQEAVSFRRLGLAVVDEQHRFGVHQRATLKRKGESPDVLVMTATPIPRTLALTLYGDLEVSVIDQLPPGRKPVLTRARPGSARGKIYRFLREQVSDGRQVYVVCPLVEESEVLDLQAATEMAERLQGEVFTDLTIGLLHGRMPFAEKDRVMREFKAGAIHVLVSTTVIEVGIDVPNATVMLVEHAERFGLSQLHQLRGRVGRGPWKSYCILLSGASSDDAKRRLEAMTATNDGFKIAEADLSLRGPGDFFGTRQSGLPEFRVADLLRDAAALEAARRDAVALIREDPNLVAAAAPGAAGRAAPAMARQAGSGRGGLMRVHARWALVGALTLFALGAPAPATGQNSVGAGPRPPDARGLLRVRAHAALRAVLAAPIEARAGRVDAAGAGHRRRVRGVAGGERAALRRLPRAADPAQPLARGVPGRGHPGCGEGRGARPRRVRRAARGGAVESRRAPCGGVGDHAVKAPSPSPCPLPGGERGEWRDGPP